MLIDADGRFSPVAPATALQLLTKQGLVTPLSVAFGETVSLAGYRLEPAAWRAGGEGALVLYWQPQRRLSLALANLFQVSLRLVPSGASEPIATVSHPVLPGCLAARDLAAGAAVPVRYSLSLPATSAAGSLHAASLPHRREWRAAGSRHAAGGRIETPRLFAAGGEGGTLEK